jgi:protease-4
MPLRADELIDRRQLRRKLTFWRIAAIAIAAIVILAAGTRLYRHGFGASSADQIAKMKISGLIAQDDDLIAQLEKIREDPAVKALILEINSPGGTTVGGESLYDEVRRIAAEKPVVAEVGTLAASAAYMVASAADHIVAHRTSIVGSIGVLIEYPDVTGLMDKLGIKLEAVKSSPLKAEPSPFNPTTDQERAMVRKLILDSYGWFVGIVAERRKLTHDQALALSDGSIFTGQQGVANKLVDEIGGERQAIAWLGTKGVDPRLKVVEWEAGSSGGWLFARSAAGAVARWLGGREEAGGLLRRAIGGGIFLDGLQSVWHGDVGRPE